DRPAPVGGGCRPARRPSDRRSAGRTGRGGAFPMTSTDSRARTRGASRACRAPPGSSLSSRRDAVRGANAGVGGVGGPLRPPDVRRARDPGLGEDRVALPFGERVASGGRVTGLAAGTGDADDDGDAQSGRAHGASNEWWRDGTET